jgi:hypothetical protein
MEGERKLTAECEEFARALSLKFTSGFCDRTPKDYFSAYQLAYQPAYRCSESGHRLELDGGDDSGLFIKNTEENERVLFYAVDGFIVDLIMGMEAAGVEVPSHVREAFNSDIEFNDLFVHLVMRR